MLSCSQFQPSFDNLLLSILWKQEHHMPAPERQDSGRCNLYTYGVFFHLFETARLLVKLLVGSWEAGIPSSRISKLYRSVKGNRYEQDQKRPT